ncbi:dihydroorotase [Helicobacter sp. T3_23-1056]
MHITLTNPLDMHLHLRDGAMLKSVLGFSASEFVGAVIMPNLNPPIDSLKSALAYKKRILDALESLTKNPNTSQDLRESIKNFSPFLALYITQNLSSNELEQCAKHTDKKGNNNDCKILKLYPKGATTGSENGIKSILSQQMLDIFSVAQDFGFILCIHGESAGEAFEREYEFGEIFAYIASHFPRLKIIIEHLSDHRSLPLLDEFSNIYATLTMHHITLDINALVGGALQPHYFCKPVLKRVVDREALASYALNANPKVSFGSDSAPHSLQAKFTQGAAGIFSAPNLLAQLAEFFDSHDALENLQAFVSDNAMKIYGLESHFIHLPRKVITLERGKSTIPNAVRISDGISEQKKANIDFASKEDLQDFANDCVIPFRAGEQIKWQVRKIQNLKNP